MSLDFPGSGRILHLVVFGDIHSRVATQPLSTDFSSKLH